MDIDDFSGVEELSRVYFQLESKDRVSIAHLGKHKVRRAILRLTMACATSIFERRVM
jgi:hypothetical protein